MAMDKGEIYVIVGDGSYLMLHSEILTALKEHIKINILLLDNSGYQCIKNLQMAHGSKGFGNEFRFREETTGRLTGDFTPVDFKKYAEALGVKAFFAEDVDKLRFSLEKARSEQVCTLIEVKVLPGTMTEDITAGGEWESLRFPTAKQHKNHILKWQRKSAKHGHIKF